MVQHFLNRCGVIILLILCMMMLAAIVHGQEKSMVLIQTDSAQGVGSLIGDMGESAIPGWRNGEIITALHVIEDSAHSIRVTFSDGAISTGELLRSDKANDLAWIKARYPSNLPVLPIGLRPNMGDKLRLFGRDRRQADFELSLISDGKLYGDCILKPGDSGGAVCNEDGCIVGVISGGWFWLDRKDRDGIHMTWPLRAGLVR